MIWLGQASEHDADHGETDEESDADDESSLGFPDLIVDQSRTLFVEFGTDGDAELDPAEHEPSLGSSDNIDQTDWATGNRLDLEEHCEDSGGVNEDDGDPLELWLPTGNRPDGRCEMRNQTTGETVVWQLLSRDGRSFL